MYSTVHVGTAICRHTQTRVVSHGFDGVSIEINAKAVEEGGLTILVVGEECSALEHDEAAILFESHGEVRCTNWADFIVV